MKTWVIGDIHGKLDFVKEILEEKDKKLIFVMDVLDSFEKNYAEQIEAFDLIMDAVYETSKVDVVLGNHELSYVSPLRRASGWSQFVQNAIDSEGRMPQILNLPIYLQVEDFLITHAGISNSWVDEDVIRSTDSISEFIVNDDIEHVLQVGWSRMLGMPVGSQIGGPVWCDHWYEFEAIPNVKQIFGHTARRPAGQSPGIVTDGSGNWNIDCLDRVYQVLELDEDKEPRAIDL